MIRIDAAKRSYTCTWWISGPLAWPVWRRPLHPPPRCELRDALTEEKIRRALTELSSYRCP